MGRKAISRLNVRLMSLALVAWAFLGSLQAMAHETDLKAHFEQVHGAVLNAAHHAERGSASLMSPTSAAAPRQVSIC